MKPLDRDRPAVSSAADAIKAAASDYFEVLRGRITAQLQREIGKAEKDIEARIQYILDALDFDGYEAFIEVVREELRALFTDAATEAAEQVGVSLLDASLDLVNTRAVEFAQDRAAEMVGMKVVGGKLVPNPNAQWQITEGTREMLRRIVTDAMEEGFSNDKIADALSEIYAFSDERSEVIARTETARADIQGNLAGWKASGVVGGKRWLVGDGCCDECQALDGEEVGIDDRFPDEGGDGPPLHPQCRCDVLPVLSGAQEQDQ